MRCLYLTPSGLLAVVEDPRLDGTSERHKLELNAQPIETQGAPVATLVANPTFAGLIIEMYTGWVGRDRLLLADAALSLDRRVWLYWPGESAVECVNRERLSSHWRHWLFITGYRVVTRTLSLARRIAGGLRRGLRKFVSLARERGLGHAFRRALQWHADTVQNAVASISPVEARLQSSSDRLQKLDGLIANAAPVPFAPTPPSPHSRLPGVGVYLRLDYWARIESGGSYGHTCYVAKELAAVSDRFVCFLAHEYRLLNDYGLRQVVVSGPASASEDEIVRATQHYLERLRPAFEALRPSYIYERICIGNHAGAILSRELGIPYIVEYNGSEISMRRSFDGQGYVYEYEYLKAEALAFAQATMISVVSEEVKKDLVGRGIDPNKILVNPNGADLHAYAPATPAEKAKLREELGFDDLEPVVGFTGTFGGWHGIDVLAAALPKISARAPHARFLLIGDGNYKHVIDECIEAHGLEGRVKCVGRVPQAEGARLLRVCDLYVSPHSSHMVDSKFFGSPTKIFEYMAMGGGIVASDLEQIGQVLSPALVPADFNDPNLTVSDERAVLCTAANVDEFVDAVAGLLDRPHLWPILGQNAREAVERHYSWTRHVARLWTFLNGDRGESVTDLRRKPAAAKPVPVVSHTPDSGATAPKPAAQSAAAATGDVYKDEVQRQWDNDPAGSHYVKAADPHTLDWFLEAEAYRYGEYAPWMAETMEFARHSGEQLLELGGGMGTDLAQFAKHGAVVTDLDLSAGHLELAKENFRLRGLQGQFVLHDAEKIVFPDNTFDVVYSNGVIHHTPHTRTVVQEIYRVLKPGGKVIVMVYAENSLHYWRNLVWAIGLKQDQLRQFSMGEIMSRSVERSDNAKARPLVKVYTPKRLRSLFSRFEDIQIVQRQMVGAEKPRLLSWMPLPMMWQLMGWNLVIKAHKPTTPVEH
jgi:glycosyltransferase involved in cell wall biosynthesis/ubiquinone/menaquinone biosynthesis C-methylase UbiE